MTWTPREPKWHWRRFLTEDEQVVINKTDQKLEEIASLRLDVQRSDRSLIINRAIHRAKYGERR